MKHFFLLFFEISVSTSLIVLTLLVLSPLLSRRYAAKWKYAIWIALAFRLLIPLNPALPLRQVLINVPGKITSPLIHRSSTAIPVALPAVQSFAGITWLDFIAFLWLAVCLCFLLVHFLSFLHYKTDIIKNGTCVENRFLSDQLLSLQKELRIKKHVDVLTYSGAASPMMIGFFRAVLVLPDTKYSREELYFILKHELIHLKRHDLFFKLLFVITNAIRWFNPFIYVMRKEANIEMELSCDEKVVWGTSYAIRKAYTKVLLSTLYKQYKNPHSFTTQFYGGTRMMKMRFQNILLKSRKKNGLFILTCTVGLTVFLGMMTGCSVTEQTPMEQQNSHEFPDSDTQQPEPSNAKPADNPKDVLSDDAQEIKRIVEDFAAAYFRGDTETIQRYLSSPYEWDIEVYEGVGTAGAGTVSNLTLKGLSDTDKEEIGSTHVISLEFQDSHYEDMFIYLTIEFVRQEDGWKIQFYGLEG